MAVAGLTDDLPVVPRRNVGRAAHGLGDDGADVAFLVQDVLHVLRALQAACAATVPGAVLGVGRRHVLRAGQQRTDVLAEDRLPADRDGVQGCAVERIPHRQRLESAGGHARELQGDCRRRPRLPARTAPCRANPARVPSASLPARWPECSCTGECRTGGFPSARGSPRPRAGARSRPGARCCRESRGIACPAGLPATRPRSGPARRDRGWRATDAGNTVASSSSQCFVHSSV